MRIDAQIDRKQVSCPNVSHIGFDKYKAQTGDIIVYRESDTSSRVARVVGRVAYAPALSPDQSPIRNYLVVAALSDDLAFAYERWVNPADVTRIYDPNDPDRNIPAMINFFFSPEFKNETVETLRRWTGSGFATPADNEAYMRRIRA